MDSKNIDRGETPQRPCPGPFGGNKQSPYQFNAEEMRVLRECNKESFFQRCLPMGALLGGGVYYGVKSGILTSHPKYGATPKVVIAVVVGYFAGKFSYQGKCAEKLMQLPNSPVGEMLRQRRKGGIRESLDSNFGPGLSLAPFGGVHPSDTYSDVPSRDSLDLDTTRPDVGGLDDSFRPSIDNPVYEEEMPPVQKSSTSYEELRRRNRDEYQQRRIGSYKAPDSASLSNAPRNEADTPNMQRNKYGDTWD